MHGTEADRDNNFGGRTLFFWGVSKPIVHKGAVYWGWNRVTRWGLPGVLVRSQGHFMRGDRPKQTTGDTWAGADAVRRTGKGQREFRHAAASVAECGRRLHD
jgi:hypothetical protein